MKYPGGSPGETFFVRQTTTVPADPTRCRGSSISSAKGLTEDSDAPELRYEKAEHECAPAQQYTIDDDYFVVYSNTAPFPVLHFSPSHRPMAPIVLWSRHILHSNCGHLFSFSKTKSMYFSQLMAEGDEVELLSHGPFTISAACGTIEGESRVSDERHATLVTLI